LLNWFEKTAKQLRSSNAMRSEPLLGPHGSLAGDVQWEMEKE